jgi:spermidine synthase
MAVATRDASGGAAAALEGGAARRARMILWNVFAVASCALVYELALGTLASYALGDAVREISITLGTYLAAMGLGALASGRIGSREAERYVEVELALAVTGGIAVPGLLAVGASGSALRGLVYAAVALVGGLVGLELPLLVRILNLEGAAQNAVSRAMGADYAGAFVASIAYPALLVPHLGLARAGLVAALANAAAALSATFILRRGLGARAWPLRAASAFVMGGLALAFATVGSTGALAE